MRPLDAWICVCLVLGAGPALAADPQQGKLMYETYCGTCHYEKLHERKNTEIRSMAALKVAVAKWAMQVKRNFTPAEQDDIAEYLNLSHYRLDR